MIKFPFAIMAKRRMPNIMRQSRKFNEVSVYVVFREIGIDIVQSDSN